MDLSEDLVDTLDFTKGAGLGPEQIERVLAFTAAGAGIGTDTLYGFESLTAGGGNDLIDFYGTTRPMTLSGGYGNDTYVIRSVFDVIEELVNRGETAATRAARRAPSCMTFIV